MSISKEKQKVYVKNVTILKEHTDGFSSEYASLKVVHKDISNPIAEIQIIDKRTKEHVISSWLNLDLSLFEFARALNVLEDQILLAIYFDVLKISAGEWKT